MDKNLYFDEAGYTGSDLLDANQPYFVLAGTLFDDSELDQIKKDIDLDSFGKELHFVKMKGNWQGREMLRKIFNHPLMNSEHVKFSYAVKRYCIYAQIVDVLVETFMHYELHEDLYKSHGGMVMANILYTFAVNHKNQELVRLFEKTFVELVRQRKNGFFLVCRQLFECPETNQAFKELLIPVMAAEKYLSLALVEDNPFYLDTTLTLFVQLIEEYFDADGVSHDVYFDNSKPIAAKYDLIVKLRDILEQKKVGYGERKHTYPLPIKDLQLVDSAEYLGVQLADLTASAFAFVLTSTDPKLEKFRNELLEMPFFKMTCYPLAPSTSEYISKAMNEDSSEDVNPLDFIAANI